MFEVLSCYYGMSCRHRRSVCVTAVLLGLPLSLAELLEHHG